MRIRTLGTMLSGTWRQLRRLVDTDEPRPLLSDELHQIRALARHGQDVSVRASARRQIALELLRQPLVRDPEALEFVRFCREVREPDLAVFLKDLARRPELTAPTRAEVQRIAVQLEKSRG